jgi:plasmid stabilization system protein ParE
MKIEYSPLAQQDLRDILEYGHYHWGESAAWDFVVKLEKNFDLFIQNPEAGRRLENTDLSPEDGQQRFFSFGNYKVIYEVTASKIFIHGVIPKDRPRLS